MVLVSPLQLHRGEHRRVLEVWQIWLLLVTSSRLDLSLPGDCTALCRHCVGYLHCVCAYLHSTVSDVSTVSVPISVCVCACMHVW